jgi:putative Mn2+ efflux pump MntP
MSRGKNMNLYSLLLIALALSLDAFGIAICVGLNDGVKLKNKLGFIASFGFFQFLFALIGAYAGIMFNTYITSVPNIIGGAIISLVGVVMIKEGFENKGKCPLINPKMCIILGISVSIDAMVVGFTVLDKVKDNLQLFQ